MLSSVHTHTHTHTHAHTNTYHALFGPLREPDEQFRAQVHQGPHGLCFFWVRTFVLFLLGFDFPRLGRNIKD